MRGGHTGLEMFATKIINRGGAGGRRQKFLVVGVSFGSEGFLGFSSQN